MLRRVCTRRVSTQWVCTRRISTRRAWNPPSILPKFWLTKWYIQKLPCECLWRMSMWNVECEIFQRDITHLVDLFKFLLHIRETDGETLALPTFLIGSNKLHVKIVWKIFILWEQKCRYVHTENHRNGFLKCSNFCLIFRLKETTESWVSVFRDRTKFYYWAKPWNSG